MRISSKKRLARIVLFAALALMFWLFNLTVLMWVFIGLVLIPLIAGAVIWIVKSYRK